MKRMWDKPELVKLIEDNAPEITVDDALSGTSENPVQNKVINTALGTKQDSLPSTTGEEGKFLKVGSSGLEWANAGGGKYLHNVILFDSTYLLSLNISIISNSNTPYTTASFSQFLNDAGYDSSTNGLEIRCDGGWKNNSGVPTLWAIEKLFSDIAYNRLGMMIRSKTLSGTISGSDVVLTLTAEGFLSTRYTLTVLSDLITSL